MDAGRAAEARELAAEARAWLEEWLEEGVEWQPAPPERPAAPATPPDGPAPDPHPAQPAAASSAPSSSGDATAFPRTASPASERLTLAAWPEARTTLEAVRETLGECTRCPLHEGRRTIVFGHGNPDAELMFIGEGPGEQEDRQGLPFVGRAGELLTRMIERGLGIPRVEVYICNIVKCRPPGNRNPLPPEVEACRPFLDGQIQAVRPKVIVTLGKPASSLLLGRDVSITRVRGTWHHYGDVPVMPTFHPAYILRQYTESNRRLVWQDLQAALARARGEA